MSNKPDPNNHDCTDFPTKGCRNCGRKDRPQYDGWCNDDSCSQFELKGFLNTRDK